MVTCGYVSQVEVEDYGGRPQISGSENEDKEKKKKIKKKNKKNYIANYTYNVSIF